MIQFPKINWKIRLQNPIFYLQLALSFCVPVMAYLGINAPDITTWEILFDSVLAALSNPYCLGIGLVSVFNAVVDSSKIGIGDDEVTLAKVSLYDENEEEYINHSFISILIVFPFY